MSTKKLTQCALFTALTVVGAWISFPLGLGAVSLQTLAVFACLLFLGGKYGCVCIACYLCLGAFGLPVFSSFRGGFGVLLGPTGGYLFGLLVGGFVFWALERVLTGKWQILACVLALFGCYVCGVAWLAYTSLSVTDGGIWVLILQGAAVYLPFDVVKIGGAVWIKTVLKNPKAIARKENKGWN